MEKALLPLCTLPLVMPVMADWRELMVLWWYTAWPVPPAVQCADIPPH